MLLASLVTASVVMLSIAAWQLRRGGERAVFRPAARLSLVVLAPSIILAMFVGSELGVVEGKYQPMKIAAAEAQWTTCQPCSFSLFQIGGGNNDKTRPRSSRSRTCCRCWRPTTGTARSRALTPLQNQYQQKYGPGNYVPNVFIQYWSMRVMAYAAGLIFILAGWGLWLLCRKKLRPRNGSCAPPSGRPRCRSS